VSLGYWVGGKGTRTSRVCLEKGGKKKKEKAIVYITKVRGRKRRDLPGRKNIYSSCEDE